MEIIDKSNKEYSRKWGLWVIAPYISFARDKKRFFLNASAAQEFELPIGCYCHFAIDIGRLYIYFDKDECGVKSFDNNGGLVFRSAALISLLSDKNPDVKPEFKFQLRRMTTRINGATTLEVMLHKKSALRKKNL